MKSAVYEGRVVHYRRHPIDHRFTYRLAMPLVYLDEIEELCRLHPLWSSERLNVVTYRRADYLRPDASSLEEAVRDVVHEQLGRRPSGPIAMLAHPRTWNWVFNPVTFYYCFDPLGASLEALVAEVTNTPWHERHVYVVGSPGTHRFPKELHVSPFFGMDLEYLLSYETPSRHLSVRLDLREGRVQRFHAGLHLERRDADRRQLGRLVWSYPFMTARVSAGIYRQAFALWRGGAPFVGHPGRHCQATPEATTRERPEHLESRRQAPRSLPREGWTGWTVSRRMREQAVITGPVRPGGNASAPRRSGRGSNIGRLVVGVLGRRLASGTLRVDDEVGTLVLGRDEPEVRVGITDARTYGSLLRRGSVGLGQSYADGWWECNQLTELVQLLLRNRGRMGELQDGVGRVTSALTDPVRRRWKRTPAADKRHVRAHYDIGNEFFSLMLDPTMSYSCAFFERPEMTLEQASVAKMDRICRKLGLTPNDHVMEIGTGWGGFAIHAASRFGCRVTSTTISAEQHAFAAKRVADLGLADRVNILFEDYRDLRGQFDKLVSIEMIEAVDWPLLDVYFESCARLLRPDGLMALQAITISERSYDRAKNHRDFIKEFIFPGGCLPSVQAITAAAGKSDLRVVDLEDIGLHYAETLRRWRAAVDDHWSAIEQLGFDERFRRLWRLYLCYCEAAFLERHVSDVQVVLAKPRWRPLLLSR